MVQSLDELLIVLRRSSGLRFDPDLPHFHLYGTDIVQTALASGKGAYVVDAPVIHNSKPIKRLDRNFWMAFNYMVGKWRGLPPIQTPVCQLVPGPVYRVKREVRAVGRYWRLLLQRSGPYNYLDRPQEKAIELGYETLN